MSLTLKYVRNVRSIAQEGSHLVPKDFCTIVYRGKRWFKKPVIYIHDVARSRGGHWMCEEYEMMAPLQGDISDLFMRKMLNQLREECRVHDRSKK